MASRDESDDSPAMKELRDVLEDLGVLLKNPEVGSALAAKGVNISLALVATDALVAYVLDADKARAAEDFGTVAEEIGTRLARSREGRDGEGAPS